MERQSRKVKVEFTEDELLSIMNILTVKSLSNNIDQEDKMLGTKISRALKEIEKSS